jgi:hypothetical protein
MRKSQKIKKKELMMFSIKSKIPPVARLENGRRNLYKLSEKYGLAVYPDSTESNRLCLSVIGFRKHNFYYLNYAQSQGLGFGSPSMIIDDFMLDIYIEKYKNLMQKTFKKPGSYKFSGIR